MSLLRHCLARLSRRLVFTRRLPAQFGRRRIWVTPGASLAYYHRLESGRWRDLLDFAGNAVQPGDCVWDVGANLGIFAFAAAHQAGRHGEVLAVEPDPWLCHLMRRSILETASEAAPVQALCCAVAERSGIETFSTPARARSGSHLASVAGASTHVIGPTVETNPVVTVTLDWLLKHRRAPAVVKVDVEGAELALLRGADELLKRHRPRLLLEVHEAGADAVTALLHEAGYELLDFSAGWSERRTVPRAVYHTLAWPA